MAMSPGMKMMMIQRTAQDRNRMQNQSEYGGGRRMIGYDRSMNGQANSYLGTGMNGTYNTESNGSYSRHPMQEDWEPHNGGRYNVESRRRRDSRGRYMMGGMDDEDETQAYRPRMMEGFPRSQSGGSYGDIYADIYAPGAMNRPHHSSEHSEPVDEETARHWVKKMDGGEHFRPEQADQLRAGICPECKKWEFYVALNAMYSDHCETSKRLNMDKPEFYAHLAKDFLMDEDAKPHKLRNYMEHIAK